MPGSAPLRDLPQSRRTVAILILILRLISCGGGSGQEARDALIHYAHACQRGGYALLLLALLLGYVAAGP